MTAANDKDLNQAENLLLGDEDFILADAGYRRAEKREELKNVAVDWHIVERLGKIRTLREHARINRVAINIEYMKTSIRFVSSNASLVLPRHVTVAW